MGSLSGQPVLLALSRKPFSLIWFSLLECATDSSQTLLVIRLIDVGSFPSLVAASSPGIDVHAQERLRLTSVRWIGGHGSSFVNVWELVLFNGCELADETDLKPCKVGTCVIGPE